MVTVEVETTDVGRRDDLVDARVDDHLLRSEHPVTRRHEAERIGAASWLQKPVTLDRLVAAVRVACTSLGGAA